MSHLWLKCTKFDFGWAPPDSATGAYSPPDTLTRFKGPTSKGEGERREERWEGKRERRGGLGRGEGKSASPILNSWIRHWYPTPPVTGQIHRAQCHIAQSTTTFHVTWRHVTWSRRLQSQISTEWRHWITSSCRKIEGLKSNLSQNCKLRSGRRLGSFWPGLIVTKMKLIFMSS